MSVQWPNAAGTVAGFDSTTNIGSIPNSSVSLNALTLGAISFNASNLPNFPDGQGSYKVNGISATINPTGSSSSNFPNLFEIDGVIDPSNAGFNMSGGVDSLHISSLIGSTGGMNVNYGPQYAVHAVVEQKSGTTSVLGAFKVEAQLDSGATATHVTAFQSTANLNGTVGAYTGVDISPSGSSAITPSQVVGLNINLTGLSGVANGAGQALNITNGSFGSVGTVPMASGNGVTQYNLLQNGAVIASAVTGTTQIVNDLGGSLQLNTGGSIVSGASPLPVSYMGFTSGTRLSMASGTTVDTFISNAAGVQINTGNLGTLSSMTCFQGGVFRNLASTGTITNAYGFRISNDSSMKLSGGPVTNAWGVSIEDPGCKNLFAGQVQGGHASAAAPSYAFTSAVSSIGPNSGMYYDESLNGLAFSANSAVSFYIGAGSLKLTSPLNTNDYFTLRNGGAGLVALGTSGSFSIFPASGTIVFSSTGMNLGNGTPGMGISVTEGANACQGVATLSGGTVTVSTSKAHTASRIFLTAQDSSSTGALYVSSRVNNTSFTITSSNAGDSGVVAWEIFQPG